jgi:hypothetical protein
MVMHRLLKLPPGMYAPEGPNGAGGCCTPSASDQPSLGLGHADEQLSVQEVIPESAIERFGKVLLPR